MKARWLGEEQKPYRYNGVPQTHAAMLERHVAVLAQTRDRVDRSMYEPEIDCQGMMVMHGHKEVMEDGTTIPHWDGSAHFHTVVCLECMDEWTVESDYRKVQMRGTAGVQVEDENVEIPW